jgi:hypothetical protein
MCNQINRDDWEFLNTYQAEKRCDRENVKAAIQTRQKWIAFFCEDVMTIVKSDGTIAKYRKVKSKNK